MLYDFHTHTFLSDGELLPMELIRRCVVKGYTVLGISDHVSDSTAERVIKEARRDAEIGKRCWDIDVLVGGELTHVPAAAIAEVAERVLAAGAQYVVVHGETVVEPVEPGTNHAAIVSGKVDILAHPDAFGAQDARSRVAADEGVLKHFASGKTVAECGFFDSIFVGIVAQFTLSSTRSCRTLLRMLGKEQFQDHFSSGDDSL
jgi:histidinol phosphatase-like PHP family hydrolase